MSEQMKEMGNDLQIMLGLLLYPLCIKGNLQGTRPKEGEANLEKNSKLMAADTSLFKVVTNLIKKAGHIHL